jgi:gliding motility-associated-like protein
MKKLIILLSIILSGFIGFSQPLTNTCLTPNCPVSNSSPTMTSGVASLGSGGIYGCLGSTPNPIWNVFQATTTGTITMNASSSGGQDVDYCVWGPFSSPTAGCAGISAANILACSYTTSGTNTPTFPSIAGQYYILLTTNFSNSAGVIINYSPVTSGGISCGCPVYTPTLSSTQILCNGGNSTITLAPNATGPFNFTWTPNISSTTSAIGPAGNYSVTMDSSGCSYTTSIIVTQPSQLTSIMIPTNETCFGQSIGSAFVSPSGGTIPYTYLWSPGGQVTSLISNLPIGTYTVTITDANNCTSTNTTTITQPPAIVATYTTSPNGCEPWSITYTNTTLNTTAIWTINGTQYLGSPQTHLYPLAGTYNATLITTDINGCADTTGIITSTIYQLPSASFNPSPYITSIANPTIIFSNTSSGGSTYLWAFGDGTTSTDQSPSHTYTTTGEFTILLTVTTSNGCIDTSYQTILINELFSIYIPNAFTPNGDGRNDTFGPVTQGIKSYEFMIFNRWGERLYSTENGQPWDGYYQGRIVKQDVYTWKLFVTDDLNKTHDYVGKVTCISGD